MGSWVDRKESRWVRGVEGRAVRGDGCGGSGAGYRGCGLG